MGIFGAIQSPADHRDYIYGQMVPVGTLPPRYVLPEVHPVRKQEYGNCVGQAAAGIKEYQEAKNYPGIRPRLSPVYVYGECKRQDGIPDTEGTYPRTAMAVLLKQGVCLESTMPESTQTHPYRVPAASQKAHDEAKQFVIGAYARIQTLAEIKQAIAREGPAMGAAMVCENFIRPEPGGFIPMPEGAMMGGHAVTVTGWDDTLTHTYRQPYRGKRTFTGFLRVRNSWGVEWGDRGYCWIPHELFHSRLDVGMPYWMESWSSVDVILPPKDARQIVIVPGQITANVDGVDVPLDQPAEVHSRTHRTLVPLRFIAEHMGWHVHWDGVRVILSQPNRG
ncbi:MAG: C1 family peptidase [Bacillota bacterium]